MSRTATELKRVAAGPTKAFFVRMLVRDIELEDAILDLLDNCVDGVVRERHKSGKLPLDLHPYEGFWARINATPEGFEIWDNCGGIPEEIARNYAFMLGRPDLERDSELETVGMYGIGMKRAIFKMGQECTVSSQPTKGGFYEVHISREWMGSDNWDLELANRPKKKFDENGTRIVISDLREGIGRQFDTEQSTFLTELKKEISRHYALIIDKGFSVYLNDVLITPVELTVLSPTIIGSSKKPQIEPYVFSGDYDGIQVDVTVGFYQPLVKSEDHDEKVARGKKDNAGWTVICNDRVVVYNDKTPKTGWGTQGVANYHTQFISIAGVVVFRSKDSMKLPLNTTKRGLDTSSDVYHIVLEYMQDGLKKFIAFTYAWKGKERESDSQFQNLQPIKPAEAIARVARTSMTTVRKNREKGTGAYFLPDLPKPEVRRPSPKVCFNATDDEIKIVREFYFGDRKAEREEVGRKCFDESLAIAKGE